MHWDNVSAARRHIPAEMEPERRENQLQRFNEHAAPYLEDVQTAIDWGCGGGLLAKELISRDIRVTLVDVSADSLLEATSYTGAGERYLLPGSVDRFPRLLSPDLLLCYAVIQHFPGYAYFCKVARYWNDVLKPTQMLLHARYAPDVEERTPYWEDENYMFGLSLPGHVLATAFRDYGGSYQEQDGWVYANLRRAYD